MLLDTLLDTGYSQMKHLRHGEMNGKKSDKVTEEDIAILFDPENTKPKRQLQGSWGQFTSTDYEVLVMAKVAMLLVPNVVAIVAELVKRRMYINENDREPAGHLNDGELAGDFNGREPTTGGLVGELPDVYPDRTDTHTGRGVTLTLSSQGRIVYATGQGNRDVAATGYAEAAVYNAHHKYTDIRMDIEEIV
ncbi:hypothetical protein BJV82DRAFT_661957 [Fennellomyces sp. T-0311]|nr:hypothetical protein BJV82DRAFT_661957 [Fennellomyces sp. T-0311]